MKTHLHPLSRPALTHALLSIDLAPTYTRHEDVSYLLLGHLYHAHPTVHSGASTPTCIRWNA